MIPFSALRLGYGSLLDELEQRMRENRLPYGFLFVGPPGVGKSTVSLALVHLLLGSFSSFAQMEASLTETHPLVHQIKNRSHPEFTLLSPSAGIEGVRFLKQRLSQTALSESWRVAFLPQIHRLNAHGVNGLLKILETPPPKTLFLLTASGPLAKTLYSRCSVYAMRPLSEDRFSKILRSMEASSFPSDPLFRTVCQGCVGRAHRLREVFPWIQQSWDLLEQSTRKPCLLPPEWLSMSLEFMELWQELLQLWVHSKLRKVQEHGFFLHFDVFFKEVMALVVQASLYHTDPTMMLYAIHSKITSFFQHQKSYA